jgi:hypothetical protein
MGAARKTHASLEFVLYAGRWWVWGPCYGAAATSAPVALAMKLCSWGPSKAPNQPRPVVKTTLAPKPTGISYVPTKEPSPLR